MMMKFPQELFMSHCVRTVEMLDIFNFFFGQVCTQVLKFSHDNWKGGVHFQFPFLVKLRFATAILGLISVFFLPFRFATAILGLTSVFLLAFWFVSAILALISV